MGSLPEVGSRWRDKETRDIAVVEQVENGFDAMGKHGPMVTIRYTQVYRGFHHRKVETLPLEMFEHFWQEFLPHWKRIDGEWLGS